MKRPERDTNGPAHPAMRHDARGVHRSVVGNALRQPTLTQPCDAMVRKQPAAGLHARVHGRRAIATPHVATSYVLTLTPARYISRFCSQFSHKLAVNFDESQGRVEFDFGIAFLHTDNTGLYLSALSDTRENLEKLKHLIATHFERFAWQAQLELDWQ